MLLAALDDNDFGVSRSAAAALGAIAEREKR